MKSLFSFVVLSAPLFATSKTESMELLLQKALQQSSQTAMVVDNTVSSAGAAIYRQLYTDLAERWTPYNGTLVLSEKSSRGSSSYLTLSCNMRDIITLNLNKKNPNIKGITSMLVGRLQRYRKNQGYLFSPDLKGNGIN